MKTTYPICPVAKPRQTRSDKWKQRPCVMRYREFADQVRGYGLEVPEHGSKIIFHIPMPKSWAKSKKHRVVGTPHRQKPDLDNLIKALLDAVFKDDSKVYEYTALKLWSLNGAITIIRGENHG